MPGFNNMEDLENCCWVFISGLIIPLIIMVIGLKAASICKVLNSIWKLLNMIHIRIEISGHLEQFLERKSLVLDLFEFGDIQ